jgi:hypothetical protein
MRSNSTNPKRSIIYITEVVYTVPNRSSVHSICDRPNPNPQQSTSTKLHQLQLQGLFEVLDEVRARQHQFGSIFSRCIPERVISPFHQISGFTACSLSLQNGFRILRLGECCYRFIGENSGS